MADSEVDICNDALMLIGAESIIAIDPADDSPRARLCARFYRKERDACLRAHPWKFAKIEKTLTALTTGPVWRCEYAFQLPNDPYCLRVLSTDLDDYDLPWEIEGRTLVTDEDAVKILYIARILDVTQYDSLFCSALVARLSATLCVPIGPKSMVLELWQLYQGKMQEAETIDSLEGRSIATVSDKLISVRY